MTRPFTIQREVSIGDIAVVVIGVLSVVAMYFHIDTRLTVNENRVEAHERRITTIESSYFVPRQGSER